MSDRHHQEILPVFSDVSSDFDIVLPKQTNALKLLPIRLKIKDKVLNLAQANEYAISIYESIVRALSSEWHQSLSSNAALSYENQLFQFIPWLNKQNINLTNRYSILKDYEIFRVNENGVKPQSTGLALILKLLEQGIHAENIDLKALQYISLLIKNTTVSRNEEPESVTLSSFFASMPWLRKVLGENNYLSLESPKRLIDSFGVVVASTLLFILETKSETRKQLKDSIDLFPNQQDRSKYVIRSEYCANLLNHLGQLTNNRLPANNLTELLLLDFIPSDRREEFLEKWHTSNHNKINFWSRMSKTGASFYTNTDIFSPENWSSPSEIEQLLFAWLCAWQAVQHYDVLKLKYNDFIINKNNLGRPVSVQIRYYKGRSGRYLEPPMLDARQIEARAILAYLEQKSDTNTSLCSLKAITLAFHPYSILGRLARLFNSPVINHEINQNLKQRGSSRLFLNAFLAISNQNTLTFGQWKQFEKNYELKMQDYRAEIECSHPTLLFNLSSIKNTAVHSKSDHYRDGDLINQNSHSSQTEKISYLTDINKDWVNQNGRITRVILDDIANYVYQPNIRSAVQKSYDMTLRSRVIKVAGDKANVDSFQINSLGQVHTPVLNSDELEIDPNDIIVLDTPETVVNMLHYIDQAENKQHLLITHSLSFFENTVLPTVEWMQSLIQEQLSSQSVQEGESCYEEIKSILPELFSNELRAGVGS